jgi:hypothetical protein
VQETLLLHNDLNMNLKRTGAALLAIVKERCLIARMNLAASEPAYPSGVSSPRQEGGQERSMKLKTLFATGALALATVSASVSAQVGPMDHHDGDRRDGYGRDRDNRHGHYGHHHCKTEWHHHHRVERCW